MVPQSGMRLILPQAVAKMEDWNRALTYFDVSNRSVKRPPTRREQLPA